MAPNAPGLRPYIINKDVGAPLQFDPDQWPATNADGLPIIEPTPEQKYAFDTNGWLLIPSVLSEDDLRAMREFCVLLHRDVHVQAEFSVAIRRLGIGTLYSPF